MTSNDRRILDAIERGADRIVSTLQDLIRFESVVKSNPADAGPGERECQQYLAERLNQVGFSTELWEPDGPALYRKYEGRPGAQKGRAFEGRPILGGLLRGSGGGRSLLLTGHIDVVPAGELQHWDSPPFEPAFDGERVVGRGAVDMKGGVASMLMAAEFLRELDVRLAGDLVFSTVVDEEIGGMGTLAMVDHGIHADAGILTEPTRASISPLCHGILWGRIVIDGIGGHAELKRHHWTEGGPVDAIQLTRHILNGLDVLNERWRTDPTKNHPLMDLSNQVVVTQVVAGEHPSSAAGRSEIIIDVQYLPSEKDQYGLGGNVRQEVEEHLRRVSAIDPWLRQRPPRVEWILDADCAEVPASHPFVATLEDACVAASEEAVLWGLGAHSDMGIPNDLGRTPTVNFGPGDPSEAHQPNESVTVGELVKATKIIALAAARWCS